MHVGTNGTNPLLKQTPLDSLIDRAFYQYEVCMDKKMFETAQTFADLAKMLLAIQVAADNS